MNITIESVVGKYEKAIEFLFQYKKLIENGEKYNSRNVIEKINSAGSEFSNALEQAIKLHMYKYDAEIPQNSKFISLKGRDFTIPSAINLLYGVKLNPGPLYDKCCKDTIVKPEQINFDILKDRDIYSNNDRHNAIDIELSNVLKVKTELSNFINCYITATPLKSEEDYKDSPEEIYNVYDEVNAFQGKDTAYILINEHGSTTSINYEALCRVDWTIVIDFDSNTFDEGNLGSKYGKDNIRSLFVVKDDIPESAFIHRKYSPAFYMANGASWRDEQFFQEYNIWVRKKRKTQLEKFLKSYFKSEASQGIQQVVVISLKKGFDFNNVILDAIRNYGLETTIIKYYSFDRNCSQLECDNGDTEYFKVLRSPIGSLTELLSRQLIERPMANSKQIYKIPWRIEDSDAKGYLTQQEYDSFSTCMKILTTEPSPIENKDESFTKEQFFKGADVCS